MKTKVLFLVNEYEENGDLFAFFPEELYNGYDKDIKVCYSHIGQHSACYDDYANSSREAKRDEYSGLLYELTNLIGYDLEVLNNDF